MTIPRYPTLYLINTLVWLTELSESPGRPDTLNDIPDAELDRLARPGLDWIWFFGVWQRPVFSWLDDAATRVQLHVRQVSGGWWNTRQIGRAHV